jgi:hypothetical protein
MKSDGGHFTNVVWSGVDRIGCGQDEDFFVCEYSAARCTSAEDESCWSPVPGLPNVDCADCVSTAWRRARPADLACCEVVLELTSATATAIREAWRAQGSDPDEAEVVRTLAEVQHMLAGGGRPTTRSFFALQGFHPQARHPVLRGVTPMPPRSFVQNCICVNCKFVTRCTAYNFVEEQHEVPHLTETPDFEAENVSIQVFVRPEENAGTSIEYDVFACNSFKLEQGAWQKVRPGEAIPT